MAYKRRRILNHRGHRGAQRKTIYMSTHIAAITNVKNGAISEAVYEHPFIVRLCHWVNAVALLVLVFSGLQIFRAFRSFAAKIQQEDLLHLPKAYALGGRLRGGS